MRSGLFDLYKAASVKEKKRGTGLNFDFAKAKIKREQPDLGEEQIRLLIKEEEKKANSEYMIFSPDELSRLESLDWKSGAGEGGDNIFHRFNDEDRFWIGASVVLGGVSGADFSYVKDWMSSVEKDEYNGKVLRAFFPELTTLDPSKDRFFLRRDIVSACQLGFSSLKGMADLWHKEIVETPAELNAEINGGMGEESFKDSKNNESYWDNDSKNEVFSCSNGFKVRYVPAAGEMPPYTFSDKEVESNKTSHDRIVEGNKMSICLGAKSRLYQNNSAGKIYSLRDSSNNPLVTMRISDGGIEEIRGKMNSSDFSSEVADCVLEFLDSLNLSPFDSYEPGFGLFEKMSDKEVADRFEEFADKVDKKVELAFKDGQIFATALYKNKFITGDKEKLEKLKELMKKSLASPAGCLIYFKEGLNKKDEFNSLKELAVHHADRIDVGSFFEEGLDQLPELQELLPKKLEELDKKRNETIKFISKTSVDENDFPNPMRILNFFSLGCHKLSSGKELGLRLEGQLSFKNFFKYQLHFSPLFFERAKKRIEKMTHKDLPDLREIGINFLDAPEHQELRKIFLKRLEDEDIKFQTLDVIAHLGEDIWNSDLLRDFVIKEEHTLSDYKFYSAGLWKNPIFAKRGIERAERRFDIANYIDFLSGAEEYFPFVEKTIKNGIKPGWSSELIQRLFCESPAKLKEKVVKDNFFMKTLEKEIMNAPAFGKEDGVLSRPSQVEEAIKAHPLIKKIYLKKIALESVAIKIAAYKFFNEYQKTEDLKSAPAGVFRFINYMCQDAGDALNDIPKIKNDFLQIIDAKKIFDEYRKKEAEKSGFEYRRKKETEKSSLASLTSALVKIGKEDLASDVMNISNLKDN